MNSTSNKTYIDIRLYILLLYLAIADMLFLTFGRVELASDGIVAVAFQCAVFIFFMVYYFKRNKSYHNSKVLSLYWKLLEGLMFLQITWAFLRLYSNLVMTINVPYADEFLASLDQAIGADWLFYFNLVSNNQLLLDVFEQTYISLATVSGCTFLLLLLIGKNMRAHFFIEVSLYAAIIATTIGILFPAKAATIFHNISLEDYKYYLELPGVYHIDALEALRAKNGPITLNLTELPGLTTFPSFHTASAILIAITYWKNILFIPALIYAFIMIASTPVFGGHFISDIIAGAILAFVTSYLVLRRKRYSKVFEE